MTRTATVLALSLLVGCASGLRDDRYPTGSSTMATSPDYDTLYAVNVDEGTVTAIDAASMDKLQEIDVGAEPTRIARVGDELWVTLRGERAIAVLSEHKGELRREATLPAGAEPHGIVASENGKRVYVTYSTADQVVEFDAKRREALRTFDVQDEPRWLALHPHGEVLFVGSVKHGTVSWIDLREGTVHPLELPETERLDTDFQPFDLAVRVTGDLTVAPDGTELGIPTLYVDNRTSVDAPEDPDQPVMDGYGSSGLGVSRLNPALVLVPLGPDGRPEGPDENDAVFLPTPAFDDEREEFTTFRSYPTSVTAAPGGKEYLVTMEASNAVIAVRSRDTTSGDRGDVAMGHDEPAMVTDTTGADEESFLESMPFTSPFEGGFDEHSVTPVVAGAGPRGVVFTGVETALVHSFLDRQVARLPYDAVTDLLHGPGNGGFGASEDVAFEAADLEAPPAVHDAVSLSDSVLPEDVEAGRRLFFSATDARMAASGAGVSCSTCHFDGRNDGVTWVLDGQRRQTPSLAGPVDQTAPVTWSEEVGSVADEAMITSGSRMGGDGLSPDEAALVEAFISWTRYPDVPEPADADLVDLGEEIFERADVGCASCHSGELLTDNQSHLVIGKEATQTPTLRGIAASAPYFHDGSAKDLRGVLLMARSGAMGDTSSLTDHELDALEAYLRSL